MRSRWSAIAVGSVTAAAMEVMLGLFGMGVGLWFTPIENQSSWLGLGVGAGIYLLVSLFVSFLIGGAVASRLFESDEKEVAWSQGVGVWATSTCAIALIALPILLTGIDRAAKASVAATGMTAMLDEIQHLNPRIVSDLSLLKGKVVTTFHFQVDPTHLAEITKRETDRLDSPSNRAAVEAAAKKAREVTVGLCLLAFFGLLSSLVASVVGAWGVPIPERHRRSRQYYASEAA